MQNGGENLIVRSTTRNLERRNDRKSSFFCFFKVQRLESESGPSRLINKLPVSTNPYLAYLIWTLVARVENLSTLGRESINKESVPLMYGSLQ